MGWIGFGLNVRGNYDNGNDDWLNYDGNKNEWAVAYHGVGVGKGSKNPVDTIRLIIKGDGGQLDNDERVFLQPGSGQSHEYCMNVNINKSKDKKVGRGVYCSPNPKVFEQYAQSHK